MLLYTCNTVNTFLQLKIHCKNLRAEMRGTVTLVFFYDYKNGYSNIVLEILKRGHESYKNEMCFCRVHHKILYIYMSKFAIKFSLLVYLDI